MISRFEEIYNEYTHLVYNLALHYTQNGADAEDITQEVFVKVYQHLHKYDPAVASLKTWIYRIAINQCLDFLKARKTGKRFAFITGLFQSSASKPVNDVVHFDHPGIAAENKEELEKLFGLINELPPNQKTALILAKIESRPQKEVAEIMHVSLKAVESLLQRARQTLQKKLDQSEGF
ncbi:MAG: RNA polymerase sigma factor [Williamsia sp.]|nr:RNA polymerase sigma factor [Williamsia sp.]